MNLVWINEAFFYTFDLIYLLIIYLKNLIIFSDNLMFVKDFLVCKALFP